MQSERDFLSINAWEHNLCGGYNRQPKLMRSICLFPKHQLIKLYL